MSDTATQSVLFRGLFSKSVVAKFDQEHSSADGGAILLKAVDERLGLSQRLAACLVDPRQPGKVQHGMLDLLRQRMFAIACGYPDGNDAARLSQDPIHKLLLERDPIAGRALASQPTLSRFENTPRRADLYRMADALAETVIAHHRRRLRGRVRRITVDMDPTDDPTHGQQEFAFYNGHYQSWCYLPLVVTLSFDDEAEQHVVAVVLRPGNAPASAGAVAILRRHARLHMSVEEAKEVLDSKALNRPRERSRLRLARDRAALTRCAHRVRDRDRGMRSLPPIPRTRRPVTSRAPVVGSGIATTHPSYPPCGFLPHPMIAFPSPEMSRTSSRCQPRRSRPRSTTR